MGLLSLLLTNPVTFLLLAIPLLYSVIMHEVAHGLVALLFGDRTAKNQGRLTLNPISHLSLYGTLALFLVGFGWAKPVPVNFTSLKPRRFGIVCVALAGVTVNFILAAISVYLLSRGLGESSVIIKTVLQVMVSINLILGVFNLLPIPPLDGSKVLFAFLPLSLQQTFVRYEPFGFVILIILIVTGVLRPLLIFAHNLLYQFSS